LKEARKMKEDEGTMENYERMKDEGRMDGR
jgi:hypothetical protein